MAAVICAASMMMSSSRRDHSAGRSSTTSENRASNRDAESAYGSDVSSNSNKNIKKEKFDIEEPDTKTGMWFQWIQYRVRHFMILEVLFFIILVLILFNSYHISSQNEKTYDLISNLQSQIDKLEKHSDLNIEIKKEHSDKETEIKNDKIMENLLPKEIEEIETIDPERNISPTIPSTDNHTISSISKSTYGFNAANFFSGASVDKEYTSCGVSPNEVFVPCNVFSSEYVLMDRDELPTDKAWCSSEEEPIFTVNFVKPIKPIAVSYQHTKWNGTIPNGAPKIYDLRACLDSTCEKWEPLVSNCEYRSSKNEQEQSCPVSSDRNVSLVNKVQFRFRENHGNIEKTCVYLVRVYGEEPINLTENEQKRVRNIETCSQLAWLQRNMINLFNNAVSENCSMLYSKDCCSVCPECCSHCKTLEIVNIVLIIILSIFASCFILPCIYWLVKWLGDHYGCRK